MFPPPPFGHSQQTPPIPAPTIYSGGTPQMPPKPPPAELWAALTGVFMGRPPPPNTPFAGTPQYPIICPPPVRTGDLDASPAASAGPAASPASTGPTASSAAMGPASSSGWREYRTNEGRVFWHNAKNNKSTWEKPDELRSDVERIISTSCTWREYPQGDGRSYWHNSVTKESEWEMPGVVKQILDNLKQLDDEDWSGLQLSGKCEAREKYKEFLERKCIGHLGQWEIIGKILQKDPKWAVFNSCLTTGERKHIFNEYVNTLVKRQKEAMRMKKAQARDSLQDFLTRWRRGTEETDFPVVPTSRMQPDTLFSELEKYVERMPDWKVLDVRERFETFEEVASQVASTAIQKCSHEQAQEILDWLHVAVAACPDRLTPDTPLDEVIKFTRRYFNACAANKRRRREEVATAVEEELEEGQQVEVPERVSEKPSELPNASFDINDVNDLSIIQQWKNLVTTIIQEAPPAKVTRIFGHEAAARRAFEALLDECEQNGILHAKTQPQQFFVEAAAPSVAPALAPIGLSESVDAKRQQLVAKLRTEAWRWVSSSEGEPPERGPVCLDSRFLVLFLQGGSSAQELFSDYVYRLWDLYEVVRDEAKQQIAAGATLEQLDVWREGLAERFRRPGVLQPLTTYCSKRLSQHEAAEKEKGEISSSS